MAASFDPLTSDPTALLLGAVLLTIFQTAKFAQLDVGDPVTNRYIALLPGATTKDFTGRQTYWISLIAFLVISLTLYYLATLLSPEIIKGAGKQFTGAEPKLEGIPFPLYIAAIFMGLTQPVLPGFSKIGDSLRSFVHDRIEVPSRVVDISERLTTAIDVRGGTSKSRLTKEVKTLIADSWLTRLASCGDLPFYRSQLTGIKLGDPTTAAKTLRGSSVKELRDYIEKLVLFNMIAVMRKSGPRKLSQVAEWSRARVQVPPSNLGGFLASFVLSGVVFGFLVLGIWLALDMMGPSVTGYFGLPSLWPKEGYIGSELERIVPAIFVGLLVSIYMLPAPAESRRRRASTAPTLTVDGLVDFARKYASILIVCFFVSLVIHFAAEAHQYANAKEIKGLFSLAKVPVIFVRTAPSVALTYLVLLYLVRERSGRPLSFALMTIVVAVVNALLSLLVVYIFLRADFLRAFPQYSGSDYKLFYVLANVMVSVCAFTTVALFFHSRTAGPRAMNALRTRFQRP